MMGKSFNNEVAMFTPTIRETLFGDMSFEEWVKSGGTQEPWKSFKMALDALQHKEQSSCVRILEDIVHRKYLESRHYAQAWYFLRQLGVVPNSDETNQLLGVVIEVGMTGGLDLLAAYSDLSARFYNFSGRSAVWERHDNSLDSAIQALLRAADSVTNKTGVWRQPRPPRPIVGYMRINMLTPNGLHFGEGPLDVLSTDAVAAPVVTAATALMHALIEKSRRWDQS